MGKIYRRKTIGRESEDVYVFKPDLILRVRSTFSPAALSLDPLPNFTPEVYNPLLVVEEKENLGEDFEAEVIGKLEEIIGGNESYWKVELESGRVLYVPGKKKPKIVKRGEYGLIYPSTSFLSLPKRKTGFEVIEFVDQCYQATLPLSTFSQVSADDIRLRLCQYLSQVYIGG